MAVSLKVPVQHLIDNAEKQRQKYLSEYERKLEQYEGAMPAWRAKVTDALHKAWIAAFDGKVPEVWRDYQHGRYRNVVEVKFRGEQPKHPEKPEYYVRNIDRDLKVLRATSQSDVTVRAGSDLERYL